MMFKDKFKEIIDSRAGIFLVIAVAAIVGTVIYVAASG